MLYSSADFVRIIPERLSNRRNVCLHIFTEYTEGHQCFTGDVTLGTRNVTYCDKIQPTLQTSCFRFQFYDSNLCNRNAANAAIRNWVLFINISVAKDNISCCCVYFLFLKTTTTQKTSSEASPGECDWNSRFPPKTSAHCRYSPRERQHFFKLSNIEFSQFKNSFINRCLFKFRWLHSILQSDVFY